MTPLPVSGQNPFEAWNRLFEPLINFYMNSDTETEEGQDGEKNAWMILLRQHWKANPLSRIVPLDPAEIVCAFQSMWLDILDNPVHTWSNSIDFAQKYLQILTGTALKCWGRDWEIPPVVEPEKGDKRFSSPDWQLNPVFDFLKQSYLLLATTLLKAASAREGLTVKQQRKLVFYLRQFLDAISPTNALFTNPQVIHET